MAAGGLRLCRTHLTFEMGGLNWEDYNAVLWLSHF